MLQNLRRIAILSLFLIGGKLSFAQTQTYKPKVFKFGKIDPEEFNIKPGGADSSASAIAIFDIGIGYFDLTGNGIKYIIERHTRFKIINKNGYDYANLEIPLYKSYNGGSNLISMEASTYNMVDGEMVASKISKDAKFTERQDKNYSVKKFTLPNVKEGSIIEFKYKINTDNIYTLRPWYFQRSIPTLHSEFVITIPEFYKYVITPGGFLHPLYKEEQINGGTVRHYLITDVPGLHKENFVATMDEYIARVSFELANVNIPGRVFRDYTSSWPKVIAGLKNSENFGLFINKSGFTKPLLADLIKTETNPDSIVRKIFNYVKNNLAWNKEYDLYTSESNLKNIIEKKTGNSADINLCLLMLLNAAKIPSSPVLLSTRDNGTHPGLPMITAFNDVIVEAVVGDKHLFLDATDKNHAINLIGYNCLSHEGLCVDMEGGTAKWISLENEKTSGKTYNYLLSLSKENKLNGKLFITSTNYEALKRREEYTSSANESDFLKAYKSDKPGLTVKNYEIIDLNSPEESLTEKMDIEIEDNVEEGGNLAFFTPLLYEKTKENPFKLEERNFPVDFGYPSSETYRITIDLPENYVIEKLPTSEKFVLPNEAGSFSFVFSQLENKIGLISRIAINKSLFTPEEYFALKELFKNIVRKQAEQVVIKKS